MAKTLATMITLTALTTVEHDGVKYGPGQLAGAHFEATELEAEPLLQVKAVKVYDPNAAPQESLIVEQANSVLEKARIDAEAAAQAQAKAETDAQAAADALAKAAAEAQSVAEARAKLDADIKAFEEAKAAAAKAATKKN